MNRLNYFYLPNSVFDYGLSANEISVLAVLYAAARNNVVQISQKTIAEKLGIKKEETVSRCIRKLCGCGFILAHILPIPYKNIHQKSKNMSQYVEMISQ